MTGKHNFLVVVSILSGRGFPKRPNCHLVAEARFDGEVLSTDPVPHLEEPIIEQELAWELDRKSLSQHRLQRNSIKVHLLASNMETTAKESLGYVILDLRSASNENRTHKWYHLLHCKYSSVQKCELFMCLYLDGNSEKMNMNAGDHAVKSVGGIINMNHLKAVLNQQNGFYQVGPEKLCTEVFIISVTIANAKNLTQLIPSNISLPASGASFFFYFSMLDDLDITNDSFTDLALANFKPERSSVRLRSSLDVLAAYFMSRPPLAIHLCCGDQCLGSCHIPLQPLFKEQDADFRHPVTIEGTFSLLPTKPDVSNLLTKEGSNNQTTDKPCVGVSVSLRRDLPAVSVSPPVRDGQHHQETNATVGAPSTEMLHKGKPAFNGKKRASGQHKRGGRQAASGDDVVVNIPRVEDDGEIEHNMEEMRQSNFVMENTGVGGSNYRAVMTGEDGDVRPLQHNTGLFTSNAGMTNNDDEQSYDFSNSTSSHRCLAIPSQLHRFKLTIHLKSISDLQIFDGTSSKNIYVRYTYAFFGSSAPIMTHPPVEVHKSQQVLLPEGFCAFEFSENLHHVMQQFEQNPVLLEVIDRDRERNSHDRALGLAKLNLFDLFSWGRRHAATEGVNSGLKLSCGGQLPVKQMTNLQQESKKTETQGLGAVAKLSYEIMMEDLGPVYQSLRVSTMQPVTEALQSTAEYEQQHAGILKTSGSNAMPVSMEETMTTPRDSYNVGITSEPRKTLEYKAALELELWKEREEAEFLNKMRQKEAEYLQKMKEDWKRKDKERDMLANKKIAEFKMLDEHISGTLNELSKQEQHLKDEEETLNRVKADFARDYELKLRELRDSSRRMELECDNKISLEQSRNKPLQEQVDKYRDEIITWEKKYSLLDKELAKLKERLNSGAEMKLQAELNTLHLEKTELIRKLDASTKSKLHYKEMWAKALKELAKIRARDEEQARELVKRQGQELEHLRLRYLVAEEKGIMSKQENSNVQQENVGNDVKIKRKTTKGKGRRNRSSSNSSNSDANDSSSSSTSSSQASSGNNSEMEKLINMQNQQHYTNNNTRIYVNGEHNSSNNAKTLLSSQLASHVVTADDEFIARLVEERDSLLRTGVYSTQDALIVQLDRRISEAIQKLTQKQFNYNAQHAMMKQQ